MQPQLLNIFDSEYTLDNFIALNNEHVLRAVKNFVSGELSNIKSLHINGDRSSGKTHLLLGLFNHINSANISAVYYDLNTAIVPCYDNHLYVILDNIDNINYSNQINLFNLFNQIKYGNDARYIITSSTTMPQNMRHISPDLKTRLLSGLVLSLNTLDDNALFDILIRYTHQEGITIQFNTIRYLLNHCDRNVGQVVTILRQAINHAILTQRKITTQIVSEVIGRNTKLATLRNKT